MNITITSLIRRLQRFPQSPHKIQKIRGTLLAMRWRARTARSRWALAAFKGPIIAITGTKGKTTTTRLISRIFKDAGYRVGTASSVGIYVNDNCIVPGGYAGADGPLLAYRAGGTDILVIETAHGGIQRLGFGFPRCDVSVFTNITDGHLGELGIESLEDMLALKWMLVSRLRPGGTIILNADDPLLASVSPPPTARVVYLSVTEGDIPISADHFGFTIYRYVGGKAVKEAAGQSLTVADLSDAPLLLGGLVPYNAYNLMAAIAATEAVRPILPIAEESLLRSLMSFGATPDDNPGRFNLFSLPGGRVVLLAGSNRDSYRRDVEVLATIRAHQPFPVSRIIGVITAIGAHSNEYIRDLAGIALSVCDEIFIREPQPRHRRNRALGEIPSILAAAALEAGIPQRNVTVCTDSFDLVRDLVLSSGDEDRLIAVFCAFVQEPILDLCRRLGDLTNRSH